MNLLLLFLAGTGVHLTGYEMWEKIIPVYYWRHIHTSIIDFLKNCETCKLQDPGTGPETSPGTDFGTSGSSVNNDGVGSLLWRRNRFSIFLIFFAKLILSLVSSVAFILKYHRTSLFKFEDI